MMKHLITAFFFCCFILNVSANNISVSGVGILGKNTSAGINNPANFSLVQFNLQWENSWRVSTGPANWDAAWVFVKFRVGASNPTFSGVSSSGTTVTVSSTANLRVGMPVRVTSGTGAFTSNTVISSITNATQFVVSATPSNPLSGASIECVRIWEHASLNNTGHVAPNGSTIDAGLLTPGSTFNPVTNPTLGVFLYRNADCDGSNTFNNVQLRWNYGSNGINDTITVNLQVFAIEMVYVPQGSFSVGGGTISQRLARANSSDNTPFQITATPPTIQGRSSSSSASNLSAAGSSIDLLGTTTAALATGYPTGFSAFYCMKYEVTQGQYRDFLNTLTRTQQANRVGTIITVGTTAVTNRFVMSNNSALSARNGIRCDATIDANNPVTFYCDLNNNGVGNEAADGEWIACNWLSWQDGAAYLDWAGLRPMTELEFEKACRGPQTPVDGEYAWGTPFIAGSTYTLSGTGTITEGINTNYNTSDGNAVTSSTWGSGNGPLRVGIFAANTNNSGRITSGATYYGIMEMSGNVAERAVTLGNMAGRSFTGLHGNGSLFTDGSANVDFWPGINGNLDPNTANTTFGGTIGVTDGAGTGNRGGSMNQTTQARVSDRISANSASTIRANNFGFRGVRSAQ